VIDAPFALNPKARVSPRRLGREGAPVLLIDDLCLNPEQLVDAAAEAVWAEPHGTYYPGLNAPLPKGYIETVFSGLQNSLARAFGPPFSGPMTARGFFALATWALDRFGPWQRIPHYDQPDPNHLAMIHYLHPAQGGGTGFFRHTESGYEYVDLARRDAYLTQVTAWIEANSVALTGYTGPTTPGFEMIDSVEFQFNRAVIYPSCVLHCALFDGAALSDDPRRGRLTANSFFYPT